MIYTLFYLYRIKYEFCFIFLYLIYIFMFDINQIRNLFCILFIMIGVKFLQKKKKFLYLIFNGLAASFQSLGYIYFVFYFLQKIKLKKYIKIISVLFICGFFTLYLIFNGLAASFQSLGYIYFVFYFLQKIKLKKYIKIISVLFICGFFTLFIFPKAMEFFFPDKAQAYFDRKPRFGMILYYIFIIMDIFIIKCKEKIKKEDILLIKFTLFPIIFLPYSFFFLELIHRVWRNALYIKWFYLLKGLGNEKKKYFIFSLLATQQFMLIGFFLELIHRVWRNALYIKWFYLLKGLGNEKKKYFIFSLLATQQFMLIGADFIKSKEFVISLVAQIGNLGFYF